MASATTCPYCKRPIDAGVSPKNKKALHLDHKYPRSRGGGSELSNLEAVCGRDNRAKGTFTDLEYRQLRSALDLVPELKEIVIRRLAASKAWV